MPRPTSASSPASARTARRSARRSGTSATNASPCRCPGCPSRRSHAVRRRSTTCGRGLRRRATEAPIDYPPLVWVAAPQIVHGARLTADGEQHRRGGDVLRMRPVPRIPLNRSYFDASSVRFLRAVRSRCAERATAASSSCDRVARRLRARRRGAAAQSLPDGPSPQLAMRSLMRRGAARRRGESVHRARRCGSARAARRLARQGVLGLLVNGAQGDDDEAHGGHFALVTGRVARRRPHRRLARQQFLLARRRERKGHHRRAAAARQRISATSTAGRLVSAVVHARARVARRARRGARAVGDQPRVQPVLSPPARLLPPERQLREHQRRHAARARVAGPARGPPTRWLAWLAFPFVALKERSLGKAKLAFDYLCTDQTRLLPAVALEEAFASVLSLAQRRRSR